MEQKPALKDLAKSLTDKLSQKLGHGRLQCEVDSQRILFRLRRERDKAVPIVAEVIPNLGGWIVQPHLDPPSRKPSIGATEDELLRELDLIIKEAT